MFHYKLQQNDKKHLKKWGICFNFNYNKTMMRVFLSGMNASPQTLN